jgi:hypothetical protein
MAGLLHFHHGGDGGWWSRAWPHPMGAKPWMTMFLLRGRG